VTAKLKHFAVSVWTHRETHKVTDAADNEILHVSRVVSEI